jgi:hypothetical protein
MTAPPTLPLKISDMPANERDKLRWLQDIFGAFLMWNRSSVIDKAKKRINSDNQRAHLGTVFRKAYDDVASLGDRERDAAIKLAEKCVDDFAISMLALLAHNGVEQRLESGEAIRFPTEIEIVEVNTGKTAFRAKLAPGAGSFMPDRWGHWLNKNPFKKTIDPLAGELGK